MRCNSRPLSSQFFEVQLLATSSPCKFYEVQLAVKLGLSKFYEVQLSVYFLPRQIL